MIYPYFYPAACGRKQEMCIRDRALRGRTKSATHVQSISDGLKKYWKQVPNKPNNNETKNEENEDVYKRQTE